MGLSYAEQRAVAALTDAGGDWNSAANTLKKWAIDDQKLLLSLTEKYVKGAAVQTVRSVARKQEKQPTSIEKAPAATTAMGKPGGEITGDAWDHLVNAMEANADLDHAKHEKAIRSIAKAFAAQRLDEMAEARESKNHLRS